MNSLRAAVAAAMLSAAANAGQNAEGPEPAPARDAPEARLPPIAEHSTTNAPATRFSALDIERFEDRAAKKSPAAMFLLSEIYGKGLCDGGPNPQKALDWAREARRTGHWLGCEALAQCYEFGWGVVADPISAAELRAEAKSMKRAASSHAAAHSDGRNR